MLGVALSLSSFPDEAEDIFQDAIIKAYSALSGFRLDSQFSTWLYRIVVNTALEYKRSTSHRLSRCEDLSEEDRHVSDPHSNPHHFTENQQLNSAIVSALPALSEQERVAFALCHQLEMSIAEAAAVMECSTGAVKSYLYRARDKLRRLLQEYQP